MKQTSKLAGMAIAAAAASLFVAGCASQGGGTMTTADASTAKIKCYGANACKGQGECKTALNACKGQNECKSTGFMMMTEKACIDHLSRA